MESSHSHLSHTHRNQCLHPHESRSLVEKVFVGIDQELVQMTHLSLGSRATLLKKAGVVVCSLILLDLVDVIVVYRIAVGEDVDDVL